MRPAPTHAVDLGHGHSYTFHRWAPDRELNPQHADRPDIDPVGATIFHPLGPGPTEDRFRAEYDRMAAAGESCAGAVTFDVPGVDVLGVRELWTVASLEPLHLEPSVLCCLCGDHGFVRDGKWVPA